MALWIVMSAAVWAALVWLGVVVRRASVRPEDPLSGVFVLIARIWCRLVHRLRVEGIEHARAARAAGGPLIVAPNHTSGLDPALVQAALDFEPRWMMAEDMRAPILEDLWRYGRIIFVDREGRDSRSLREALRHLKRGGALGVFPEGHIERPAGSLMRFKDGVGLLALKTRARVLPVVIDGTPDAPTAWGSLARPSRSRVRFLESVVYDGKEWTAATVAADLQQRFVEATGWPVNDRVPVLTGGRRIMLDDDGRYVDEQGERLSDEAVAEIRAEIEARAKNAER